MTETSTSVSWFQRLKQALYLLFILVVAPIYTYVSLPVLDITFLSFPIGILIITSVVAALEFNFFGKRSSWIFKIAATLAAVSGIYILGMWVASFPIFRASAYHGLIGTVKEGENFAKDIAPISLEKIRIIDQEVAFRLGDKVLGEKPALGSQVDVGTFNIQRVGDELYWVAPLLHAGLFKWLNNRGGTPAYVMVSATNERDVRLVSEANGKPVRIKYQPAGYMGDNLHRHLYFHGCEATGMMDFTFEIDDNGVAYWVATLYHNKIGFSAAEAYGVAVVNAETGDVKKYSIADAPAWVDRIQPESIVTDQLNYWGEYIHGYWNWSNQDKLMTTEGMSLVYGIDNHSYWYTGITSVGQDDGTVGFVLVNTRTKEATWYKQAGATEEAARASAEGARLSRGYRASFPILYNINGVPTYVMAMKDDGGLIKMIALVSVEDYSIVGVGANLQEAVRLYKSLYNAAGKGILKLSDGNTDAYLMGRVARISQDISAGNSYYYIRLEHVVNKTFLGTSTLSSELPLTQIGDSIRIQYDDARTEVIDLTDFDNLSLQTTTSNTERLE